MKTARRLFVAVLLAGWSIIAGIASAAYHHAGSADTDTGNFLNVYLDKAGTKLDNCATCHSGGKYIPPGGGKESTLGSCQYCHAITEYGEKPEEYPNTVNPYGKDYLANGRNETALGVIASLDSDGDGYINSAEIDATRYPGDANDDPSMVVAPFRIFTQKQLQAMPQHKQFMLMNTTKSGDYYVEYSGIMMEELLEKAGISTVANEVFAIAPDGYMLRHPLNDSSDNTGKDYAPFVTGTYPQATYYYDAEADTAINKDYGWCDYSSPAAMGRQNGDPIRVARGLRLILALKAEGADLVPGILGDDNKLTPESEGPYRVVSPQKFVGPPDQPSTNPTAGKIWQFDKNADHNAGPSTKCTTMIKVTVNGELPPGTTDIDYMEAGWGYIDEGKVVVYGALEGPRLISPYDGATGVPCEPTVFKWTKSPGIEKKAVVSYRLDYTDDPEQKNWTSVTVEKEANKHEKLHSRMVKENTSIILEPNTKYWWRVTDFDKNGGSTISQVRSFTTKAKNCRR